MKRKTPAGYLAQLQTIAHARGGSLLSPVYLGDATKLRWRCAEGHVFWHVPSGVKQGRWCRRCGWTRAGVTHRTASALRLRRVVTRRGGVIVSKTYVNAGTPLRFRCAKGHEWSTVPSAVSRGSWCRRCSNEARYRAIRARALLRLRRIAHRRGGEVVQTLIVRGHTWFELRCANGHTWRSLPQPVEEGTWCQTCVKGSYLERLRQRALERGGVLLSRTYVDEDTRLRFRCAAGHVFLQRPADTSHGAWCQRCAVVRRAEKRKAPARARLYRIVAERGGAVLSPEYVNSQTRLRYRCRAAHEWVTTPGAIAQGSWCPVCARLNRKIDQRRRQLVVRRLWRIAKQHGGELLPPGFVGFKTRLQLRCARGHTWTMPAASLQNGAWCRRCKEELRMSWLRERAERWGGECLSEACHNDRDVLHWRCALGHRFDMSAGHIRQGGWCPTCRWVTRGSIDAMRHIARERGGTCLSETYRDAATKLRWRCRDGHEWSACAGDIIQGHWCPTCRWHLAYSRRRLSIEIMRETAAERGGLCLSSDYDGNKVPLRWRCARGHTWMAHPNRVRQGSWCPDCAHSMRGTLDGMRALANELGGRCLTKTWNNHTQPLRFECARGHRFHILRAAVKSGVWCPNCAPPSRAVSRPR